MRERRHSLVASSADKKILRKLTEAYLYQNKLTGLGVPAHQTKALRTLDSIYKQVREQLLRNQSFTTGLYPRYSKQPDEGYVRDSIYCAMATWAVSLAYDRQDDDRGRQYEMGQSSVKTMRGILAAWMNESDRLEKFKNSPEEDFALHCKFDLLHGEPLTGDRNFKHLQVDVVSLYLITLVQMISGGLQIVFTQEEVNFVQNLVFYIERAYRTPDYGMWERGTRYNDGTPELHASSLGMVKAALEAINGFNLYGTRGTAGSVIYVDIDAHNRNRTTFETLLPRESHSKNVDASLITCIQFPAFATHDQTLTDRALNKCKRKLEGKYGYKRFLRDGFRTAIENRNNPHYTAHETFGFDGIECQWPIFFLFLVIDNLFHGKSEEADKYWKKIEDLLIIEYDGTVIVPECYKVPKECIEMEKAHPGSQHLVPISHQERGLFLMGQSVYFLAALMKHELLTTSDIDPIHRHLPASQRPKLHNRHSVFQATASGDPVVQIALISESYKLQAALATYGIQTQTPHHVQPVQIWPSGKLVKIFNNLGKNERLNLSGRPDRPIGSLGTCKIYRVYGETVLCYPLIFDTSDFYVSYDPKILIDDIKKDLHFIAKRWKLAGRPTFCVYLREQNVTGDHFTQMLELLVALKNGNVDGVRVRVGRVQNLITASCMEHLDFAPDEDFSEMMEREFVKSTKGSQGESRFESLQNINLSVCTIETDGDFSMKEHKNKSTEELLGMYKSAALTSLRTRACLLNEIGARNSDTFLVDDQSVGMRMEELLVMAGIQRNWGVVRFCAARLRKVIDSLAPSITTLLVRGKQVTLSDRGIGNENRIIKPVTPKEIENLVYGSFSQEKITSAVICQELIIVLSDIVSKQPQLFKDMLTVKVGWMIEAVEMMLRYRSAEKRKASIAENRESVSNFLYSQTEENDCLIYKLSPTELKKHTLDLLSQKGWSKLSPLQQRQLSGAMNLISVSFYDRVWRILQRSPSGLLVAGQLLPQQPTLSDMTRYELNFALLVERLLTGISHPEYRQLTVELVSVIDTILERNKELNFSGQVNLDKLIKDAFRMFATDQKIDENDMTPFYDLCSKHTYKGTVAGFLAKAVVNEVLLEETGGDSRISNQAESCKVS